jgi:Cu(I)/Ag(I) efflux system membrane fusion protein
MEMEFGVEPGVLPKGLKPGDRVRFDMKSGKPGEFVITRIEPVGGKSTVPAGQKR